MAAHLVHTSFTGTMLPNVSITRKSRTAPRSTAVTTRALFTKAKPAVVEVQEPPKKQSLFSFGASNKKTAVVEVQEPPKKQSLFSFGSAKKKTAAAANTKSTTQVVDKASEYKKRQGMGRVVSAFDFAEVRSKSDAELLYDAKYGTRENGKMTKEQYGALRRKIGGTAKDYWKTWIDVKGDYVDKGYVSQESTAVPGLPFLIITVLGLFGALGYVVAQTS